MSHPVSDSRSHGPEQVENAINFLKSAPQRQKVFAAIYKGKTPIKTLKAIKDVTGLTEKRILEIGNDLHKKKLIGKTKKDGRIAYVKDDFFSGEKTRILRLAKNPIAAAKLVTTRNPRMKVAIKTEQISIPKALIKISQVYIDEISSFQKVKRITSKNISNVQMPEKKFKNGIKAILGEKGTFTDWGGEKNDLLTSTVRYKGKRIQTAFAFKGPGKKGPLTPAKMGKNGDQIQRLFDSSAKLFVLQYWGDIHESTLEQVEAFAKIRSISEQEKIFYCVINGQDSARIIEAYSSHFEA